MKYLTVENLNNDIKTLLSKLPNDIDLVVGIPRDGMLVAMLIGLYRSIPFTDVDSYCDCRPLALGWRHDKSFSYGKVKSILLVDDALATGHSMITARKIIEGQHRDIKIYSAVVYLCDKAKADLVDWYVQALSDQKLFEWILTDHSQLQQAYFDLDGVLCANPKRSQLDYGPKYENFIENAPLQFRPIWEVQGIITGRRKRYRKLTEEWLAKNNIKYRDLIMLPEGAKSHEAFKARHYKRSNAILFIESSPRQAEFIARYSKKPVICPTNNKVYQ